MPFINGGGGGAAFNGGTITSPLRIDLSGHTDAVPLSIVGAVNGSSELLRIDDGNNATIVLAVNQIAGHGAGLYVASQVVDVEAIYADGSGGTANAVSITKGSSIQAGFNKDARPFSNPIAPTTVALVSGTGAQVDTTSDVDTVTPFTGDATNNAATCQVEISPNNVTYTTLNTMSIAAALNLTGALDLNVNVRLPKAWYIRLTATHGALGTTTYY